MTNAKPSRTQQGWHPRQRGALIDADPVSVLNRSSQHLTERQADVPSGLIAFW